MSHHLLDTSVIIDYLRGKDEVVEIIDNLEGEVSSSFVCLAELFEGVAREKNPEKTSEKIIGFFGTFSKTYGLDEKIARKFGETRKELKDKGTVIEDMDILIAATCLANDLVLLTKNEKHFARVKGLRIKTP